MADLEAASVQTLTETVKKALMCLGSSYRFEGSAFDRGGAALSELSRRAEEAECDSASCKDALSSCMSGWERSNDALAAAEALARHQAKEIDDYARDLARASTYQEALEQIAALSPFVSASTRGSLVKAPSIARAALDAHKSGAA